jgi:ribosomal protein S12 methylthiotransferase accessory factor
MLPPFRSNFSKSVRTGTHRIQSAEEMLAKLIPLLPAHGITRVANITGLDDIGIPTVLVARPNSRSLSVSQGKGITLTDAKVSGIMESIEQFYAERVRLPLYFGSYAERLHYARTVDVAALPGYVRPFDPDAGVLWATATDYATGAPVDVPFELVHLNLRLPLPSGSGFFPIGSNGLASGSELVEAVAHASWELIERDAAATFYVRPPEQQARRRLRLETVDDEPILNILDKYTCAGVAVGVWDMTTDIGIPAFLCSIVEREYDPFRPIGLARGYGCHNDRCVALCRALCEAAQSRLTRISGSRDDGEPVSHEVLRSERAILEQRQQLRDEPCHRHYQDVPTHVVDTFGDDLQWLLSRLLDAGLGQVLYLDLSDHGMPFSVARVIIPGLEGAPDVPGYVPGRRARAARELAS